MFMRNPSVAIVGGSCVLVCSILAGCSSESADQTPGDGAQSQEQELAASPSNASAVAWHGLRAAALRDTLETSGEEAQSLWSSVYLYSSAVTQSNYVWARGFFSNLASLPECAYVDVGNGGVCQRVQCRPTLKDTSVGEVHVLGTSRPVNLSPDSSGVYPTYNSLTPLYPVGSPVLALVSGDDQRRGAFVALSFAPEPLNLTSPKYDPEGGIEVDRNSDFQISWTPSKRLEQAESRMNLYLGTNDYSSYVNCGWPQRAGKGTVPAELLRDLPTGAGVVGFATMVKNVREPNTQKRTELRLSTDVYVQGKLASGAATFK